MSRYQIADFNCRHTGRRPNSKASWNMESGMIRLSQWSKLSITGVNT
ncbi:MAG: hypothetical protein ACOX86_11435 [Pelotomaculaceae bacterium]